MLMAASILVAGRRISNTNMVLKLGRMVPSTKVHMSSERSMALEHFSWVTAQYILVNSSETIFMARVSIPGQTLVSTKENGALIKCMVKEYLLGQTIVNISVNTSVIKNVGMVNSYGQMEDATVENGKMENNTERGTILQALAKNIMGNGKTANV